MDTKETFGAELAKQLPVSEIYNDLAKPTISTIGQTLQGATRVALAPLSAMIWGYDKIAAYLDVAIPEYFAKRKISKEKIVSPDPSVAGPLIDAMRYNAHKEEPRKMFVNLLGSTMNSESNDAHPAFVEVIKQLSSDECKMLIQLYADDKRPMLKQRLILDGGKGEVDLTPFFSDICYCGECQYPEKFPEYLDNLSRLGIITVSYGRFLSDDKYYAELRQHPAYPTVMDIDSKHIKEEKSYFQLSSFGKLFYKVCID